MKNSIFMLLRWLTVALAVVLLLGMYRQDKLSTADMETVQTAVLAELDLTNMQEAESSRMRRLYALNPADYEACLLYSPKTNMEAEELLLVKLRDAEQQEVVLSAIEARLATQKTSFEGYGVEQTELLTDYAVVEARGNYILFVVNRNSAQARRAFLDAL